MTTPNSNSPKASSPSLKWEQVREAELEEVRKRRRAAGYPEAEKEQKVEDNLFGLALSGGGIRSASFNLGLLQALVQGDVLRHVDLLSTVSGGGYIGAFLDSLAYRRHSERGPSEKKSPPPVDALKPIRPLKNGGQPAEVMHLVAKSHYLNDTVGFVNRYLIGFVLLNFTLFLGVAFLATVVATQWRLLDKPPIVDFLLWLSKGYVLEWNRPFLPGLVLLLVWALIWVGSFVRVGTPALAHHSGKLLFAAVAFLLIGLAVWLGTPNMNFSNVLDPNFQPHKQKLSNWPNELTLPLGILLLLALLPFLRPWELIKSGARTNSFWRQWVFKMAGLALLVGIPFAAVHAAGRHNISGVASRWDRPLNSADFLDWESLVGKMKEEVDRWKAEDNADKKQNLVTPGTLFYQRQLQTDRADERDALARLQDPVKAYQYQRSQPNGPPWPWSSGPWPQSYPDYINKEREKDAVAHWMTQALQQDDFMDALLKTPQVRARVRKKLAELTENKPGGEEAEHEAEELEKILRDKEFRAKHPVVDKNPKDYKSLAAGHLLLRAFYPTEFRPIRFVSRPLVIVDDQWWRVKLMVGTGLAFLLFALSINFNITSMHGYYRSRLQRTFIVPTSREGKSKKRDIALSDLKNTEEGLPYHLMLGSVEVVSGRGLLHRRPYAFLFSRLFCGSRELGFCPTTHYRKGENELSSAAAISGAAVEGRRALQTSRRPLIQQTAPRGRSGDLSGWRRGPVCLR